MFSFSKNFRKFHFNSIFRECTRKAIPQGNCTNNSVYHYNTLRYSIQNTNLLSNTWCLRRMSSDLWSVQLNTDKDVVRFSFGGEKLSKEPETGEGSRRKMIEGENGVGSRRQMIRLRRKKMSKKHIKNELRFYRIKARKKMKSNSPAVRIKYKLGKAKRKEEWLIAKIRKYEIGTRPVETHDPEMLTEDEKFYLKRIGEKKKHYVPVGRRGVFGGVVLNMHQHWLRHETVKVSCRPCRPGQIHEYAAELARLSHGIILDIKPDNTILFYRGKNYVLPEVMSPPDTLSKPKALEKYKFQQSLEHTGQFIEKLEKELEEYLEHLERFKSMKKNDVFYSDVDG